MEAGASLEQALEYCLGELTRTGDIESGLRRYPQYADRLRPLLEIAQTTRVYYQDVPAAPGGLVVGRERMLAAAEQQRAKAAATPSRAKTFVWIRVGRSIPLMLLALTLTVVMAMMVLGGGLVWAAADSLPGDLLYPIKISVEDVRTALSPSSSESVELALEFVGERASEIQALAVAGRPIPDEAVNRLEWHVERALAQAATAGDAEITTLLGQIQRHTRDQAQVLDQVRLGIPLVEQPRLERAVAVCRRGAEAAEEGLRDPQTFRRRHKRDQYIEPSVEPEQEQPQYHNEEEGDTRRPTGTPEPTYHLPAATSVPRHLTATAAPKPTSQEPKPTSTRQVTPPVSKASATATMQKPAATATLPPPSQDITATAAPQEPEVTPTPQTPPTRAGMTATPRATHQGPGGMPVKTDQPSEIQPPGDVKGDGNGN